MLDISPNQTFNHTQSLLKSLISATVRDAIAPAKMVEEERLSPAGRAQMACTTSRILTKALCRFRLKES